MVQGNDSKARIHCTINVETRPENIEQTEKLGVIDSDLCVHCWGAEETEDHVLYDCRVVKQLWRRLKKIIGYGRAASGILEQELQLLSQLKPTVQIQNDSVRLVFVAFVY